MPKGFRTFPSNSLRSDKISDASVWYKMHQRTSHPFSRTDWVTDDDDIDFYFDLPTRKVINGSVWQLQLVEKWKRCLLWDSLGHSQFKKPPQFIHLQLDHDNLPPDTCPLSMYSNNPPAIIIVVDWENSSPDRPNLTQPSLTSWSRAMFSMP